MKLTKRQTEALGRVLRHLERGSRYLFGPDVRVCVVREVATTTVDYVPNTVDGAPSPLLADAARVLAPIERTYGSDLVALRVAEEELARFLEAHGFEPEARP